MAEQDRKQVQKGASETDQVVEDETVTESAEDLTDRIDDILDEIDAVLEENAEEFVKNYVQKGGE